MSIQKASKETVKLLKAALDSGDYKLEATKAGRAASLAKFCAPGKPGEHLVRGGWSEEKFAIALAAYMHRLATSLAKEPADLANALITLGATNSSAAKQAAATLNFIAEGVAEKYPLGDVWQACLGGSSRPADSSLLGLED